MSQTRCSITFAMSPGCPNTNVAPLRAPHAGLMSWRYAASARESCFAVADRASASRLLLGTTRAVSLMSADFCSAPGTGKPAASRMTLAGLGLGFAMSASESTDGCSCPATSAQTAPGRPNRAPRQRRDWRALVQARRAPAVGANLAGACVCDRGLLGVRWFVAVAGFVVPVRRFAAEAVVVG
jgi:hypothetical protein